MALQTNFIQAKRATLKIPISLTETGAIILSVFTDIYGNALAMSDFGSIGYLTIAPGQANEEIISFTGFTQNADGSCTINTGITRGLAAKTAYGSGGTAYAHSAGDSVIVLPDNPQLFNSIIQYVNSLVLAEAVAASDATVGYVKTTVDLSAISSRVQSVLVSQQASPTTTVLVSAFAMAGLNANVQYAGGNSPAIANPATNPRIDLIVYAVGSSSVLVRQGTENASITTSNWATFAPTPTSGDIVLAAIFNRHVSGAVTVKDRDDSTNAFIIRWYEAGVYTSSTPLTATQINAGADQTQATGTTAVIFGGNTGGSNWQQLAQSFVPTVTGIQGVRLYKAADTGTFTGTVTIALQADSSGNPSGSDLATYTITNAVWLLLTAGMFTISFSTEYASLVPGNTYWIIARTSTTDNSNHPNLGNDTASSHSLSLKQSQNAGSTWTLISSAALNFQTLAGRLGKLVQTDATAGLLPSFVRPYSLVAFDTTNLSINNSTTETTVFSKILDGGFFTANSGIKISVFGTSGANGSSSSFNVQFAAYLNGTSIGTNATGTTGGTNGTDGLDIYSYFTCVNNASLSSQNILSSLYGIIKSTQGTPTVATSAASQRSTVGASTTSIDTSQPIFLKITMKLSSQDGTHFGTYIGCLIEKIG